MGCELVTANNRKRMAISEKIITEKFPTPEMVIVFRFIETASAEQDK